MNLGKFLYLSDEELVLVTQAEIDAILQNYSYQIIDNKFKYF